jgi:hypothetical protein
MKTKNPLPNSKTKNNNKSKIEIKKQKQCQKQITRIKTKKPTHNKTQHENQERRTTNKIITNNKK